MKAEQLMYMCKLYPIREVNVEDVQLYNDLKLHYLSELQQYIQFRIYDGEKASDAFEKIQKFLSNYSKAMQICVETKINLQTNEEQ